MHQQRLLEDVPWNRWSGFSLTEVLAVIAILGVIVTIAALYLKPMEAPLRTGAELVDGLFRQTRARAMATTTPHRVRPFTPSSVVVESASSCSSGTWTLEPDMEIELPQEVTLTDTSWTVCFISRGTAASTQVVTVQHPDLGSQQLEVLMGGAVRWLP